jgi:uncharacterized protein involved in exopolysaccharide biosynthesis
MEELISQLLSSVRGIWKNRWLAVATMWMIGIAGWAWVATLPGDYQSSARVFVDTQSILKPLMAGMATMPDVEQQVAVMSHTLLSRPNVERVMRIVDLDLRATPAREHEQQVDQLMARLKISATSTSDIYTITYNNSNPRLVRDVVQALLTISPRAASRASRATRNWLSNSSTRRSRRSGSAWRRPRTRSRNSR